MAIERHMFVNYKSQTITVSITTYENVGEFQMLTSGESVEELIETHSLGGQPSVTWNLNVPAGGIRGFGVYGGATFTNPDEEHLTVITSMGKNPWPPPPPPPSLFEEVEDYEDRYEDFLMSLSGQREERRGRSSPPPPAAAPAGES